MCEWGGPGRALVHFLVSNPEQIKVVEHEVAEVYRIVHRYSE